MAKKPVIEKNNTPTINPIGTEKYIPAKKVKFDLRIANPDELRTNKKKSMQA